MCHDSHEVYPLTICFDSYVLESRYQTNKNALNHVHNVKAIGFLLWKFQNFKT